MAIFGLPSRRGEQRPLMKIEKSINLITTVLPIVHRAVLGENFLLKSF